MFSLSPRVTESIKVALAITIIYAIAFYMGWEKPYWATVSAASVNLLSHGMTLHRGLIRVAATIGGGCVGLVIIGLFPQERWMYMAAASIPLFIWGYGCAGEKEDYVWVVGGITFMVVLAVAMTFEDGDSGTAFDIVQLRVSQTLMGSGIMVLISVYLWPQKTISNFEATTRKGFASQRQLLHLYRDSVLLGEDTNQAAKQLRLEDAWQQEMAHFELHIAENDSFEMIEERHQWHHFLHLAGEQINCLESLRESRAEVKGLKMTTFLPDFEALCADVDQRFEQIDRMLANKTPSHTPQPIDASLNEAEMQTLSRFQRAAVELTRIQLQKLDELSRSLFDCIADLRMFERPDKEHDAHHHAEGPGFTLDLDQITNGFAVVTTVWVAFLIWILVYDVPMHSLFWAMTGIFTVILAYRSEVPGWDIYWSWAIGTLVAIVCYTYIMQHLDGYRELGAMIFIACFLMYYVLYPRPHPVGRMFALISFCIVLNADNIQHYHMEKMLLYALWLFGVVSVAIIVRGWFLPSRPEKFFLRLLDRFFRHANWLISQQAQGENRKQGLVTRLKAAVYRGDLAELPRKLAIYANLIDYKLLPGTTREQAQELVVSVYALAYRMQGLVEAGRLPQADLIDKELLDEKQDWHQGIEAWFRRQVGATQPMGPPAIDLPAQLDRLESRIDETLDRVGDEALAPEDYQHFHRLLGSYRSLSEAAVDYARASEEVDWPGWREMRFPVY